MKDDLYTDSIYFIEVDKISPNPYQPRREFDQARLNELSESIRQYGVLQPLVVSRIESQQEDGGIKIKYELIAGERRLRASKLAGLLQVPVVIRKEHSPMVKLELAIIENLQREDLNPIDRARAFLQLTQEFNFTHKEVGKKVGKSRVFVSNSLRLLQMPQHMIVALEQGRISEGHTRPLLMLKDRVEEQEVLFKEIIYKKITVRDAERLARRVAKDKVRKKELLPDPELEKMEHDLQDSLGTRVYIKRKEKGDGGQIMIDFFSNDDLGTILEIMRGQKEPMKNAEALIDKFISIQKAKEEEKISSKLTQEKEVEDTQSHVSVENISVSETSISNEFSGLSEDESHDLSDNNELEGFHEESHEELDGISSEIDEHLDFLDDSSKEETKLFERSDIEGSQSDFLVNSEPESESEDDLYNISNFSL